MSLGLSHIGATPLTSALAVAEAARANWQQTQTMAALDRMHIQPARRVEPAVKVVETPGQIRAQVMAERGVDRLELLKLGPQARLEAEISIDTETAERARQARNDGRGTLVDIKI